MRCANPLAVRVRAPRFWKGARDMSTDTGKVVVNRAMSLDGFIAGPGHTMDWISDFWTADAFTEVMAATGAMLIGRGTYEVAKQMADEERNYEGGAEFVLTHEPPDKPDPNVTFLTCDIAEAAATALKIGGSSSRRWYWSRAGDPPRSGGPRAAQGSRFRSSASRSGPFTGDSATGTVASAFAW